MTERKRTLITAALPYANGPLHIGHLAGAYIPADMYARFMRLCGEHVLFLCGSDEHGVPITISAEKEKVSPQVIVDRFHELNEKSFARLGISFDYYARTSSALHRETSQAFFRTLYDGGYLIAREEPQLYDEQAKMFLPDRYVEGTCPVCSNPEARGDQCERCGTYLNSTELINPRSKVTGSKPIVRPTKHWYFALSKFQEPLEEWVESHRGTWRDNVMQGARSWLKTGLLDRPITRDLDWGVPVPVEDAAGKVLYVWFDAPIGYITATKEALDAKNNPSISYTTGDESEWQTWWQDPSSEWVCFLGKDNIVFHTIMFPAMLMAHNSSDSVRKFNLPTNVPANEFMNLQGQKLSKSRGWTVEVHELIERYPADVIRYTFATTIPEQKDTDFTWKDFQAHTNNELADIFGNFANRVLTFVSRNFENSIPGSAANLDAGGNELLAEFGERAKTIKSLYERFRLREAAHETMDMARIANKYFNDAEPWKLIKENREEAAQVMRSCLEALRALAVYFAPITPNASEKIAKTLWHNLANERWGTAHQPSLTDNALLGTIEILFTKIEDETVAKEVETLVEMEKRAIATQAANTPAALAAAHEAAAGDGLIGIDDFKKIKLRTATILEAERVPKSKKLIRLQLALGEERRQIVAGIGEKYTPEELIGKTIVVVANLRPAKLMGQESNGMLLAVNDEKGVVTLITGEGEAASGLEVR